MSDNSILKPDAFYTTGQKSTELEEIAEEETPIPSEEEPEETEEQEAEFAEGETDESEESEVYVYEVNGKEYTADDIEELERGNLRQSDYTRKTTGIADTVRQKVSEELSELKSNLAELQATIQTEELDLEALSNPDSEHYDPDEALKQTKLKQKRDKLLSDIKSKMGEAGKPSKEELQAEQQKLIEANPHWIKDGEATEEYKAEMKLLDRFFEANEWTKEEQAQVTKSVYWTAIIKAAKYDQLKDKTNDIVKKKVRKAPVVRKPKGQPKPKVEKPKSMADVFYES